MRNLSFLRRSLMKTLTGATLFVVAASPALANVVGVLDPDTRRFSDEVTFYSRPGDKISLEAALFVKRAAKDGKEESEKLEDANAVAADFAWKVLCQEGNPCKEGSFTEESRKTVSFVVPELQEKESLEIEVTHTAGESKAKAAKITVVNGERKREFDAGDEDRKSRKKTEGLRSEKSAVAADAGRRFDRSHDDDSRRDGKGKDKDKEKDGKGGKGSFRMNGGGGKSSSADGDSSKGSKKSDSKKSFSGDRFAEGSFGFGGSVGAGGGGKPQTGMRGYNRDNITPVVSCARVAKAGGGLEFRCEQPSKKVLRVRRELSPEQREAYRRHWLARQAKGKKHETRKEAMGPALPAKPVKKTATAPAKPPVPRSQAKPAAPKKTVPLAKN